ncbi:T9SS type A sorting domain-containing protein [Agriterribacter sp.]|uniref:T9SS type A sorting domain-containing protein n=1 Tax=Agriterribacter sp. TaxID=2821509 RepID=UPI002B9CF28A|nr:T9SS type A sorting domain-containing protein [Agriterribacter sp.]HRP55081.1 T9SS type A sorting domain-containing protein [Agriterribacter sp.]
MKKNSTLILFFVMLACSAFSQTTYIDDGSSATYTLQAGDSLYIRQGTFTGKINNWSQGAKITIAVGATFKPSSVNGYSSEYVVYGTAILPSLQTAAGFGLENYGAVTVNGNAQMNGSAQTWTNANNATLHFTGSLAINANGSHFINYGEVIIEKDFSAYASVSIVNRKNVLIGEDFVTGSGQLQNEGYWYAKKSITFNNNAGITNTCRMVSGGTITVNSGTIYNSGLLWASNEQKASAFTNNNGTIISLDQGIIKAVKFTNNGTIKGNGFMYLTGKTTGGGTIGVNGYTTDTLKVYTVSRSSTTRIFDEQWGNVHSNTIYFRFDAPDTTTASTYPCYAASASIILPLVWNDFSVSLASQVPVLTWSAESDHGTLFEVQRSYNGKEFVPLVKISRKDDAVYQYYDRELSTNKPAMAYYRIKVIEPGGLEKYSDIKTVSLGSAVVSGIAASPNPFTSQLTISYRSPGKEKISIAFFNLQGQVQLVKAATVTSGSNNIVIAEAARFEKGFYILKITGENGAVASRKLLKQ